MRNFCAETFTQALAFRPDHADCHNNLGFALRSLNRHEEALRCFELAQAIKPDHVDAQLGEGLVRLALGDYAARYVPLVAQQAPRSSWPKR